MKPLPYIVLIINIFILNHTQAQTKKFATFGKPTQQELDLSTYEKDPDAAAVVLFESGNYRCENIDNYLRLVKKIHVKIKVLDASKFNGEDIKVYLYKSYRGDEKISEIKAITHNGNLKKYVAREQFYENSENSYSNSIAFTFPDVRDGSILEYYYKLESPFIGDLGGWAFQSEIPTMYSEFYTEILGNYKFNISLRGLQKLDVSKSDVAKSCIDVDGFRAADCITNLLIMKDVPAFKKESYMLGKPNYLSRVAYELVEYVNFSGNTTSYGTSWKHIEKELKEDKDLGLQLYAKSYFKRNLPSNLFNIKDPLQRAKSIYSYIQDHYTWNGNYRTFSNIRVKNAFKEKKANNAEINISLINALNAADLDAHIFLISTRDNGTPNTLFPVISEFNYVAVALEIDGKEYLLDATRKNIPFGILPFDLLNEQGRIINFKDGSSWEKIIPYNRNVHYVNAQLTLNDGSIKGTASETFSGYLAISERNQLDNITKEKFSSNKNTATAEIDSLKIKNLKEIEKPLEITYNVSIDTETVGNKVYLSPFFFETFFTENPFLEKTRKYPINFGHTVNNTYLLKITLEDGYKVFKLPESKIVKIPNGGGSCSIAYQEVGNTISVAFKLDLKNHEFPVDSYISLKEFFLNAINFQSNEVIVLSKN